LTPSIGRELKEKFLMELTPAEKAFFLRKAREAVAVKRYRPSEDLFHYCYFLTLRERLRGIRPASGEGYLRFLRVEGDREVDDAVRLYEERLHAHRLPAPSDEGEKFIEFFSS
jgi:hypothetical protein